MNPSIKQDVRNLTLLFILAAVIFGFRLGSFGLLDPDEPFYSLTAKEMLGRHDWSTPVIFGQPQFEKPILFYWFICLAFKIFGVSEFAARLGPFLSGTATVLATYLWGFVLFKRRTIALISAVILATSAEFMSVSRIVLTDMFLCLFVTLAFYCFSVGYENPALRKRSWFFIFVSCALGFLTKGPLAVILPWMGVVAFLWANQELGLLKQMPWGWGLSAFIVIALPWYARMTALYGTVFLRHFFVHENFRRFFVAEHRNCDKIFFYPAALLVGFFPWGAFVLGGIFYSLRHPFKAMANRYRKSFLFLALSFAAVFIFFTLAKSKLLSYILPVFPVCALMIGAWAYRAYRCLRRGGKPKRSLTVLSVMFFGIFPVALIGGCAAYGVVSKLDILWPVFLTGVFLIPLSWAFLYFASKRKFQVAFYCVIAAMTASAIFIFGWLVQAADSSFASREDVRAVEKLIRPGETPLLLADRLFVRGVCYYSGSQNVGVLTDNPEGAFYTKHAVRMISKTEDLLALDKSQFPVYGFLKPKGLRLLDRIADHRFSYTTLRLGKNKVLVRLDRV